MTKKQALLVGRIWAGSILSELDGGFTIEDAGADNEEDLQTIVKEANRLCKVILKEHPSGGSLPEIIKYVESLKK